jgi:glycosyltransferase involved in cell wall biosynthesis
LAHVLYLTLDGITDHIGQAQIAPYLLALAACGHKIHVVSAEKPGRDAQVDRFQRMFCEAGIGWSRVAYANKPPLISTFLVLRRMERLAGKIVRREGQRLVHVRAYLPFGMAVRLKRRFGAKLLLDFRDFWADVGIETKRFKFVYRHLKRREPLYFAAADRVVTLTRRAAEVLLGWYPKALGGDINRYQVIPCCADFDFFDPAKLSRDRIEALRRELDLGSGPVLLYLGSINHDYLVPEMFGLFAVLLRLRPDAKFLFVTNTPAEAVEPARVVSGVPAAALRFTSTERALVPDHIALADLSVIFIRPTLSKAGCSPTKLAELFAMGVPVIANHGVGDLDELIGLDRNGSVVVPDFEEKTLVRALRQVLDQGADCRPDIRASSGDLTLEAGVRRYDSVYRALASEEGAG